MELLLIAKYYPPRTGARAIQMQRVVESLCKHTDIKITLITQGNQTDYITGNKEINRINIKESKPKFKLFSKIVKRILGDIQRVRYNTFVKEAFRISQNIIKERKIDYVFTVSSPFDSHLVGYLLAKQHKTIKWITFFSDPFPLSIAPKPYSEFRLLSFYEKYLTQKVLHDANSIIVTNSIVIDTFHKNFNIKENTRFHVIQHCGPDELLTPKIINKGWLIHSGLICKKRTSKELFLALKELSLENKDFKGLVQYGAVSKKFLRYIKKYKCDNLIVCKPEVSKEELKQIHANYEVALIIEAPMKKSVFLPSKLAELVFYNEKIVAITPDISPISELNEKFKCLFTTCYKKNSIKSEITTALLSSEKKDLGQIRHYFKSDEVAKKILSVFQYYR